MMKNGKSHTMCPLTDLATCQRLILDAVLVKMDALLMVMNDTCWQNWYERNMNVSVIIMKNGKSHTMCPLTFKFVVGNFIIIPTASTKLKGGYTGFILSICLSGDRIMSALYFQQYWSDPFHYTHRFNELVSSCTSFRLSVCGQNRVSSLSSTILFASISYLHILSSNFRRCAACKVYFKTQTFEILANSLNLWLWLCLLLTWDPIWLNSMGNHEAVGVSSECKHSISVQGLTFWKIL